MIIVLIRVPLNHAAEKRLAYGQVSPAERVASLAR